MAGFGRGGDGEKGGEGRGPDRQGSERKRSGLAQFWSSQSVVGVGLGWPVPKALGIFGAFAACSASIEPSFGPES